MAEAFPSHSRIVIVGGGIVGCATAYWLARLGCSDVVLLDRYRLTAGSTWHAAGAVGQLRSNANITKLLRESVKLYETLEQETGQATGWVQNGSLRLACTKDRQAEFEINATIARSFGIDFHMLSPSEVRDMLPQMSVDDVVCAAFVPSDGVANPSDVALALAKGARNSGVRIFEGVRVTGIAVRNGAAVGVATSEGHIACETVVNCAGIWAPEIGAMAGVTVPLQPSHHQYAVTDRIEGLARNAPTVRDPDHLTYYKEEVGGLAIGIYEFDPVPFVTAPIPDDHEFKLMPERIDRFEPVMESAIRRFPDLETAGIKRWFNGVESFTSDGMFILGEAPEVRNFFVGAGFNAFGIASGGGAGQALATWILEGAPPFDLWPADIRRFPTFYRSRTQVLERSLEGQAAHYAMHWPHEETKAGRPMRVSPLYERLKANRACFGNKFGWERANWFAPEGVEPVDEMTFGTPNWFEHVAREHTACRTAAGLFDQSSFGQFLLEGGDAERVLQRISAATVDKPVGHVAYAQFLNERAGIEADVTITRLADDAYFIITGTGYVTRDFGHIRRHIPDGADAHLTDVTSAYGCLTLMGPKARDILTSVCESPVSNEAFPPGTMRHIIIAGAPVIAIRVSFVGELGWEFHVPSEFMLRVYDALKQAGEPLGLADCGYRAIDSLRLEKARRVWSHDIGPDYNPIEAGLSFAVDFSKGDFVGRNALLRIKQRGVTRKLVSFTVDDPTVVLYGKETIFRNDRHVGWLTSAGFGHTIGKPLGMGYVSCPDGASSDGLLSGTYELEVRTRRVPATISIRPVYDPANERVKG